MLQIWVGSCLHDWLFKSFCLACRWTGNNGPEQTDYIAMRNLIDATPKSIKRFVLTTSAGVDRSNKIPFSILNLFGEGFDSNCMP